MAGHGAQRGSIMFQKPYFLRFGIACHWIVAQQKYTITDVWVDPPYSSRGDGEKVILSSLIERGTQVLVASL